MNHKYTLKLLTAAFSLSLLSVSGQFTITNPLTTKDMTGIRVGDNAYLTAANGVDPNGAGWLRLTEAKTNQKGFMYVLQGFPTTLGVIADFEYKDWRNIDDGYFGADGFSVYLFDATVTDANFKLGGYGGSLGYATYSNPANTTGLSGGYLGVGLDAYGNYANNGENRNGSAPANTLTSGMLPNAFVLRGPTSATYNNSNVYLASAPLGDRTGTVEAIRQRNEIDYNTLTATRPADNIFYRRVQVIITKPGNDYVVTIKWRKENQTTFTQVLSYTLSSTTYPIPTNLKLGFAASTGGGFNFQEIRNIILTTPGNLRVDSRSDSYFTCNDNTSNITFKVEVSNDTDAALNSIDFNGKVMDDNNNVLDMSKFSITSLSTTGFTNSNLPTSGFTSNNISGTIGLNAKSSGIITVTGKYYKKGIGTNHNFKMVSTVASSQITDTDTTNNTATTAIEVRRCSVISNPMLPAYSK
ncbi:hypothetical protein QE422_003294 [Chryseobacterium sp. SORGH_AS 447]|uniref:hypothetical protein n=1 Tax=Chryseobacterium sp. SORGH_AS_0447 TaxID=3041769 RepID=UPI002786C721|nr:hypothetical protein [Chryseobacterium sp. SORGH_AS_0447]MDQ1162926.1 hypothetical protein [Chryseobacterium sp. SORGH_AS_0447]